MLVYSDKNTVELLPALSSNIPAGNISGLLTRAGVRVDYLSWDVDKRNVKADLTALRDTSFNLVLNNKAYIGALWVDSENAETPIQQSVSAFFILFEPECILKCLPLGIFLAEIKWGSVFKFVSRWVSTA